jgi:hypothetical protein
LSYIQRYWKKGVCALLLVFLAVVTFDLGKSLVATCPNPCSIQQSASYAAARDFADFVEHNEHFFVAFGTIIIAIFTVVLGLATGLLWKATKALVDGASDTAERQLRAYVMIESVRLEDFEVGRRPFARVTFRNSGATPAHRLTHWCMMGFDAFPHTLPFPTSDDTALPPTPLAPRGSISLRTPPLNELNLATWSDLAAGTHAIYLAGEIKYIDAFGKARETQFVLFTGGPLGASDSLAAYREGNRIT